MKKPIIILTGPTAVGKTEISLELARACGGEIISADSMQVYRKMDIGTAKIRPDERQGIPHYMIDELDPAEEFNVYFFQKKVRQYIQEIHGRGKIPILTGGTGFYIRAVLYDTHFTEQPTNTEYRRELAKFAKEKGAAALHEILREKDPESARAIHENNVKRVIRALEYLHDTGELFSVHNEREKQRVSPYRFLYAVLTMDREALYRRIDLRVDQMLEAGLVGEVEGLLREGYGRDLVSMQGLGYKEIAAYLEGECSLEEAVYRLKRDTRHFAKRQMTWFRREPDAVFLDKTATDSNVEAVASLSKDAALYSSETAPCSAGYMTGKIMELAREKGVI